MRLFSAVNIYIYACFARRRPRAPIFMIQDLGSFFNGDIYNEDFSIKVSTSLTRDWHISGGNMEPERAREWASRLKYVTALYCCQTGHYVKIRFFFFANVKIRAMSRKTAWIALRTYSAFYATLNLRIMGGGGQTDKLIYSCHFTPISHLLSSNW